MAGMDETSLKKTANNLGSLTDEAKTALGRVDTHTYSDRGYHAQVKAKALELGKNLWQSEVDKGGNGATLASMIIEDIDVYKRQTLFFDVDSLNYIIFNCIYSII